MASTNLQRIQRNIQRLADQNAPHLDFVGYLKTQGYTPERYEAAVSRMPGGATPEAPVPSAWDPIRAAGQGLTFGFSDEGEALVKNPMKFFSDEASKGYDQDLAKIQGEMEAYQQRSPVKAGAAELGGAFIPALLTAGMSAPASLASIGRGLLSAPVLGKILSKPVGRGMAYGTGSAALTGFGTGKGGVKERLDNSIKTAPYGTAFGGAFPALSGLARGSANLASPLLNSAQRGIAGDVLNKMSTNPTAALARLKSSREIVPGSAPTTAQASGDPGLAGFQTPLQSAADPSNRIGLRLDDQSVARRNLLERIGGGDDISGPINIGQDKALRASVTDPMRVAAFDGAGHASAESLLGSIGRQMAEPANQARSVRNLLKDHADNIKRASIDGEGQAIHPEALYAIRKEINGQLSGVLKDKSGNVVKKYASTQLIALKKMVDETIEEAAPGYRAYMEKFATMSRPIEHKETLQEIAHLASSKGSYRARDQGRRFTHGAFNAAFGKAKTAGKLKNMPPHQMDNLMKIKDDLVQAYAATSSTVVPGSSTAKNLTVANVIGDMFGQGILAESAGSVMKKSFGWLTKMPEDKVQELLVDAMLDPKLAAGLMSKASDTAIARTAAALKRLRMARVMGVSTGTVAGLEMGN